MHPAVAVRVFVVAALVAACGGATPSASPAARGPSAGPSIAVHATPTPAPTPTASVSYAGSLAVLPAEPREGFSATIECSGSIADDDSVALVALTRTNPDAPEVFVLRRSTAGQPPETICTFSEDIYGATLLDARHVVIQDVRAEGRQLYAVVDIPYVRYRWFEVPAGTGWGGELLAVGPNLDQVLWNDVHAGGKDVDEIHLATADDDAVLATVPDPNEGRCGQPTDSSTGRYARTGPEAYVLAQPIDRWQSLLVIDGPSVGTLASPPAAGWKAGTAPQMALWSPVQEELFWSQGGAVWRWTPDMGKKEMLDGVTWFSPTFSADGRYLAFTTEPESGTGDIYLWDLRAAGGPRTVAAGGAPRFLDGTHLWYLTGEVMGDCTGGPQTPTIYDVTTGSTTDSDVQAVLSAWPATSAGE
jgi:hypothetical protein